MHPDDQSGTGGANRVPIRKRNGLDEMRQNSEQHRRAPQRSPKALRLWDRVKGNAPLSFEVSLPDRSSVSWHNNIPSGLADKVPSIPVAPDFLLLTNCPD